MLPMTLKSSATSLLIDETSSTDLQFPMWIYYLALPVGSALMLLRYITRLVRFTLYFDPATMTVGHVFQEEMPSGLSPPLADR